MTDHQTTSGRVTRIGYYSDTLPLLIIAIRKNDAGGLSIIEGERKQLSLAINDETYQVSLRTTLRSKHITIRPSRYPAVPDK